MQLQSSGVYKVVKVHGLRGSRVLLVGGLVGALCMVYCVYTIVYGEALPRQQPELRRLGDAATPAFRAEAHMPAPLAGELPKGAAFVQQ